MIAIQQTLVSDDVLTEQFVCHLDKCKGACCIEGDRGAPLEKSDSDAIRKNLEQILPFMSAEGIANVAQQGYSETDEEGEEVTTCLPTGECTFVVYEPNGMLSCAIEKAHNAGAIDYLKPISCHLYPIRVAKYTMYDAVNYHRWDICSAACSLGRELQMPVYRFVKNALIRKFGEDWYRELDEIASQGWPPTHIEPLP